MGFSSQTVNAATGFEKDYQDALSAAMSPECYSVALGFGSIMVVRTPLAMAPGRLWAEASTCPVQPWTSLPASSSLCDTLFTSP